MTLPSKHATATRSVGLSNSGMTGDSVGPGTVYRQGPAFARPQLQNQGQFPSLDSGLDIGRDVSRTSSRASVRDRLQ